MFVCVCLHVLSVYVCVAYVHGVKICVCVCVDLYISMYSNSIDDTDAPNESGRFMKS